MNGMPATQPRRSHMLHPRIRATVPLRCIAVIGSAVLALAQPAAGAEAKSPFFAGKTIRIVVGFGPGGGYDLYARQLGRYLGRHVAGNPTIVVQNMVGAGSLKAVNYLYSVAPRDGTVIATFARGIVFEPLIGHLDGAQFEAPKFNWIGSITNEVSVCATNASRGIRTWQDMLVKPTVIGASGAGADSDVFPIVLRNLFHMPMRIVTGYPDGSNLNLAMERGEIDGRCGWSWSSIVSRNRDWLTGKRIDVTLQIALQKHDELPGVPFIMDLTKDQRSDAALKLIVSRQSIARPFAAPPGVPADQVEALRRAFGETVADSDFRAEMQAQSLEVRPVGGAEVQNLIRDVYATPPDVVKFARDLVTDAP